MPPVAEQAAYPSMRQINETCLSFLPEEVCDRG